LNNNKDKKQYSRIFFLRVIFNASDLPIFDFSVSADAADVRNDPPEWPVSATHYIQRMEAEGNPSENNLPVK